MMPVEGIFQFPQLVAARTVQLVRHARSGVPWSAGLTIGPLVPDSLGTAGISDEIAPADNSPAPTETRQRRHMQQ
jgi:hypothetical protein